MIERAVGLESAGEHLRPLRSPTFYRALMSRWTDDLETARSGLVALEKRAREHGDEGSLPVLLSLLSEVECWSGDWEAAGSHADESLNTTRWTGQELYRGLALYAVALVEAHLGNVETARRASEEGLELGRRTGSPQVRDLNASVIGFLEISLGNPAEAHRVLQPLTEASPVESVDPGVLRFMPDEIEALLSLGQTETARALLEAFASRGRDLGRRWVLATSGRCRGLLAAFEGDVVGALDAFEEGLKYHEGVGQPFELGRTLLAQGQVQRRAKQWRAARGSLEEALQIFERLGAALWAERARAEVARIGGRPPTPSDLTPTEQRVAELVTEGLTNREVADMLFLSVSTVQANLRRIYTKLGVRSRTQLARRLASS
jgi:DNA-binding CsgD family transcriptional regulator